MPPVPIYGLPFVVTNTLPLGVAIIVGCPFRTTYTPCSFANSLAYPIGSWLMSPILFPVRAENSPKCGVTTTTYPFLPNVYEHCFNSDTSLEIAMSPSASTTIWLSVTDCIH